MSMSTEDLLYWNFFPNCTKEQLLDIVKDWPNSQNATDYIIREYDNYEKKIKQGSLLSRKHRREINKKPRR